MSKNSALCTAITGPSYSQALEQIKTATQISDLIEFRLDMLQQLSFSEIAHVREMNSVPVIFTLRTESHGGKFSGNESEKISLTKKYLELHPEYLDIEYGTEHSLFLTLKQLAPQLKIICSYHDFKATIPDLEALYKKMQQFPADLYKIVMQPESILDTMRMLLFIKKHKDNGDNRLTGICLDTIGLPTRILGPVVGNAITYAALDNHALAAKGQLSAETLNNTYHFHQLNHFTHIYGLIGSPITYSRSHNTHNQLIRNLNLNAIYVKFHVQPEELPVFIKQARELGICGLSVTMPLKEHVLTLEETLINDNAEMTSSNTLTFMPKHIRTDNTDGIATLELLQQHSSLQKKKAVILGTGGTAKAIIPLLHKAGVQLVILNRTIDKAETLSKKYGAQYGTLEEFPQFASKGYDLLINCTPVGINEDECPISIVHLLPQRIVMDCVTGRDETLLLRSAKEKQCTLIHNYDLFFQQAKRQCIIWLGSQFEQQINSHFDDIKKTLL